MTGKLCAVCRRSVSDKHVPFCSKRCADIDLGRWFIGTYAIQSEEIPEEGDGPEDVFPSGRSC